MSLSTVHSYIDAKCSAAGRDVARAYFGFDHPLALARVDSNPFRK